MEHENDGDTNCNGRALKKIGSRTGGLGNNRTSGDHPNNSIFEIAQNTGKSPGDLRKLIVTHTPVGNHLLTLM